MRIGGMQPKLYEVAFIPLEAAQVTVGLHVGAAGAVSVVLK